MHIFDKEGEQRQLLFKIRTCLPIVVSDICHNRSIYCRELYVIICQRSICDVNSGIVVEHTTYGVVIVSIISYYCRCDCCFKKIIFW